MKVFRKSVIKHIAHAFRILYKVNTSTEDALRRIEEQVPSSPEIVHLIEFVRSSKLGIINKCIFVSLYVKNE